MYFYFLTNNIKHVNIGVYFYLYIPAIKTLSVSVYNYLCLQRRGRSRCRYSILNRQKEFRGKSLWVKREFLESILVPSQGKLLVLVAKTLKRL